jgi:GNAT superfamily N-acetyltransferase
MRIRFGVLAERKALEELQCRASLALEEHRAALLAHPDAIDLPEAHLSGNRVRVAESEGAIAGFSVLLPVKDGLEVDGLFVEPALWGTGIGRALMLDALDIARQAGAHVIEVVAGPRAEGFYAKFGFAPAGAEPTRFGPAVRMTRGRTPA